MTGWMMESRALKPYIDPKPTVFTYLRRSGPGFESVFGTSMGVASDPDALWHRRRRGHGVGDVRRAAVRDVPAGRTGRARHRDSCVACFTGGLRQRYTPL